MRIQDVAGGWFGDIGPHGEHVVTVPGHPLVTHQGPVELPPGEPWGIGYPRLTVVGGFRFGGQAHSETNLTWQWRNGWHRLEGPCVGVSPVIYDRTGAIVISNGSVGSQGYRYVRDDGSIATGDETYGPWHGLSEWSEIGNGLYIGQGHDSGRDEALIWDGGVHRLLCAERSRFIRVSRYTDDAVGICLSLPGRVRLIWTTLSELRALPVYQPTQPPPPPPPPELPMITDAQFATLERLRAAYPPKMTPEQIGAVLNEWAWTHRAEGCGMQRKDGGTRAFQPVTGIGVWNGVRYQVNGQHYGQDVLGGASVGQVRIYRGQAGPADAATFVAPVQVGTQEPPPPPPPDLVAKVAALEARIVALEAAQSRVTKATQQAQARADEALALAREALAHAGSSLPPSKDFTTTADGGGWWGRAHTHKVTVTFP